MEEDWPLPRGERVSGAHLRCASRRPSNMILMRPSIYRGYTDLYGKGYSEAPHVPSDATLFVTQLALLMQYVRWEEAYIVGFSMVRFHDILSAAFYRVTHVYRAVEWQLPLPHPCRTWYPGRPSSSHRQGS